jgi:RNA polymerase sigma-70 factor (ECF subfamily)
MSVAELSEPFLVEEEAAASAVRASAVELLVDRARRGSREAFEEIYRLHVDRVHGLCLRLSRDRGRAEELTQEVFVKAFEKLDQFRGDSALLSWLHRMAVRAVLGARRSQRRREARIQPVEDLPPSARQAEASSADPGFGLDLERHIAALPTGARAVFVLYDIEGYDHQEIAAMTGLAVGTSKAQLHRARRLLRKALFP